eukprot:935133-Pelagomonas_calceolata.AAC.2
MHFDVHFDGSKCISHSRGPGKTGRMRHFMLDANSTAPAAPIIVWQTFKRKRKHASRKTSQICSKLHFEKAKVHFLGKSTCFLAHDGRIGDIQECRVVAWGQMPPFQTVDHIRALIEHQSALRCKKALPEVHF